MNALLTWIGSLLILALAALFAGPHFVDWNVYRGVFEEEASRILGRDVRVGGDVNLRLLPAPYVRFEKLRISDTTGIAGAPLFSAESFTMWLSVPPLLKGALEAKRIELERPSVTLAVNEDGYGNWRSLNAGYGSLPFVPTGVELQSVHISDGTVALNLQRGGEVARLSKINGELAAKQLAGPYTFRGSVDLSGTEREIRLATSEPDQAGTVRLNGQIRTPSSKDRYTVDLRLSNLWEQPAIEGDLSGRVQINKMGDDAFAELKAKMKGSPQGAQLSEIVASFENSGQPQIVVGQMAAEWGGRHQIDLSLSSRWLDLDRLAGGTPSQASAMPTGETPAGRAPGNGEATGAKPQAFTGPVQTAQSLLAGLIDVFPERVDVSADLRVDQVNLGGDAVSDVLLEMQRNGGPLEMKTMRAVLPGGARFDFSGQVEATEGVPVFSGDLYVGGVSAAHVISWALGPGATSGISSDGPFAVDGKMRLGGSSLQLSNARAEFSGVPIRGSVSWRENKNGKRLAVEIEGREIDTRWVGLNDFQMPAIVDILSKSVETASGDNVLPAWLSGDFGDVRLRVRADTLRNGSNELKDVNADIALRDNRIEIATADFKTPSGLSVSMEGSIAEPSKAPKGTLRFVIGAQNQEAVTTLANALGGEASRGRFTERLSDLAPFRLAGNLALSQRLPNAADIDVDGMASGGSVEAQLRLDGGIDHWREKSADILVRVKDGKAARWVANWLGGAEGFETSNSALNGGSGLLKAVGVPNDGMLTMATLDGDGFSLIYDGKSGVAGDMLSAISGEFVVNARQSNDVLGLVGIELADGAELGPAQGVVEFTRSNGRYVFTPRDMIFAGSRLAGSIAVSRQKGDGRRLEADLTTDAAYLPGLMSAVLARPRQGSEAPEDTDPGQQRSAAGETGLPQVAQAAEGLVTDAAVFSDQAFDMSPLVDLSGQLKLKASRLMFNEELHAENADLTVSFGGSRVELTLKEATVLGGGVSGELSLERAPAGVIASGNVALQGGNLAEVVSQKAGGRVLATGTVNANAKFTGRALGPRGLVSALVGSGELTFTDAKVHGLDPALVTGSALSLVASDDPIDNFAGTLRQELGKGVLPVGKRSVALEIIDGAVRVSPIKVDTPKGSTQIITTFDIAALAVDSEWRIQAKSAVNGEADWPPVTVTFVGPVAELASLEPKVMADTLERELTVRRMERNVNELERLRRLDEEAAARERARQRKIEEERAKAAAAAAAARPQYPITPNSMNGVITSEPLPPIETAPGQGSNAGEFAPGAGQPVPPEAVINEPPPPSVQVQRAPRPRPAREIPQLSPSDIMRQQLLGTN